jgi:hypothetical protein
MTRMKTKTVDGKTYEMTRFLYRCDMCNDTIESINEHIIVRCKCKNLTLTGGIKYGGLIASQHDVITDISEWKLIK